jgi:hypothetical protein
MLISSISARRGILKDSYALPHESIFNLTPKSLSDHGYLSANAPEAPVLLGFSI